MLLCIYKAYKMTSAFIVLVSLAPEDVYGKLEWTVVVNPVI